MPDGRPALLLQVIDTGPGLQGVSYQHLFDPSAEFGTDPRKLADKDNSEHTARAVCTLFRIEPCMCQRLCPLPRSIRTHTHMSPMRSSVPPPTHTYDVNSFCCYGLVYLLDSW